MTILNTFLIHLNQPNMYKKHFKRIVDVIGALLGLPFLLILILIVGILIWLEDRGNIFYNAARLGKNGKVYKMYKFRSMKMNAPDIRNIDGTTFNSKDDPRLTRIGKFIRKTSIDETPQLLNILKGDMSFIGPRPDLLDAKSIYKCDLSEKLSCRPGITGYSQVNGRNNLSLEDRLNNDIYYAKNLNLLLDIKIIFQTIQIVILSKNIYRN